MGMSGPLKPINMMWTGMGMWRELTGRRPRYLARLLAAWKACRGIGGGSVSPLARRSVVCCLLLRQMGMADAPSHRRCA